MALIKLYLEPKISKCSLSSIFPVFSYDLEQVPNTTLRELDYLCNSSQNQAMSATSCLQAMKIVHHYAHGCFDWLIYGQQSVNLSREAISILSGKYKKFTFGHPVIT